MNPFRLRDLFHRRGLGVALLIAVTAVASSVVFELPYLATIVFPGLWIALQGDGRRCHRRTRSNSPDHAV